MEGVPTSYHPAIYSWMCMLCPFYAKSLHFESLWAVLVFWLFWVSVSAQTSYGLVRQARGYKEVHFAIPQFSAEDRNHAPRLDRSFAPTWTGHLQFQWVFIIYPCFFSTKIFHLRFGLSSTKIYKPSIWGYPHLWKPPYEMKMILNYRP